jgi:hypothetical protein
VRDDRIFDVGHPDAIIDGLRARGQRFEIDRRFAEAVLLPGFIEPHSHAVMTGRYLQLPAYVGALTRTGPDGTALRPARTVPEVLGRLRDAAARTPDGPLVAWGLDPSLLPGMPSLTRRVLDTVSVEHPIMVLNMSGHIAYLNSTALADCGYGAGVTVEGVLTDAAGRPTGELREIRALAPTLKYLTAGAEQLQAAVGLFGGIAHRAGVTTASEMIAGVIPGDLDALAQAAHSPGFPVRLSAYVQADAAEAMGDDEFARLRKAGDDRLRIAGVKFVCDGSLQGFTAYLRPPGYFDGHPNGSSNYTAAGLVEQIVRFHAAGIQVALHTNGDATTDLVLDALEEVLRAHPRTGHRHRLEHNQMVTADQLVRMRELGLCSNAFVNHLYYWGDVHAEHTMGPDRAAQSNPLAMTRDAGVPYAIHSDSPVTPLDPLVSAWVATVRRSRAGRSLGPAQRIGVHESLRAVTLGAAYLLGEERERGSIERGKLADLVALDLEPIEADPESLRMARPLATVLGGEVQPIPPESAGP